jgi:hypothetical protein
MSTIEKRSSVLENERDRRISYLMGAYWDRAYEILGDDEYQIFTKIWDQATGGKSDFSEREIAIAWKIDLDPIAIKIFLELDYLILARAGIRRKKSEFSAVWNEYWDQYKNGEIRYEHKSADE